MEDGTNVGSGENPKNPTQPTAEEQAKVKEQTELIAEARSALKKGHHTKALKLIKGVENEIVEAQLLDEAHNLKKINAKKAAKKASAPKAAKKVPASNEAVLAQYDKLIAILAEMDVQRRNMGKPYRVYFFHRRQIENLRRSFIKGTR